MYTTDPLDEIFPVVDKHDIVIGKISRKEANTNPAIIHRAVGAFIFNVEGELLIQKRSATKDTFPNCWDLSVGGHVQYGDEYLETIIREIHEETGIEVIPNELIYLGKILLRLPHENEFWQAYRYDLKSRVHIKKQPDEVTETRWVNIPELKHMLQDSSIQWSAKVPLLFQTFLNIKIDN